MILACRGTLGVVQIKTAAYGVSQVLAQKLMAAYNGYRVSMLYTAWQQYHGEQHTDEAA